VHIQDVVSREVGSMSEPKEIIQTKNNPEKVWFELRNEEDDLDESTKSYEEEEQPTPIVRRSERMIKTIERNIPSKLCSAFMLTTTENEPKSVREAVDSVEGKI
jgi:hypothetical protein